jgi:hypothetical protein
MAMLQRKFPGDWFYDKRFHRWDHESGFGVIRARKLDDATQEESVVYTRTDTNEVIFTDEDVSRYVKRKP